ncbi:MAG: DUF4124 domain-containing protein [Gammaproteobacteria bacterium]|nr:DUF4124 domain-containing protein [Gammaproteobacteria bacterium]
MLVRTLFAAVAFFGAALAMAQAYRWVDENGVVHYSDVPMEGAEQIQLPQETRRRPSYSAPQPAARQQPADGSADEPPGVFKYDSIEIVSPAPEETLWNIEGVLNVSLRVTPALRTGDQVRVHFDGQPRMVNGTSFQLQEVWRGVHNIQVEIVDPTGKLMARSLTNRFYVQQNSIARN